MLFTYFCNFTHKKKYSVTLHLFFLIYQICEIPITVKFHFNYSVLMDSSEDDELVKEEKRKIMEKMNKIEKGWNTYSKKKEKNF